MDQEAALSQASSPPASAQLSPACEIGRLYGGLSPAERDAQRRGAVLDSALELFGTNGFASTSMTEVADHAQLAFRYVARLFPDKEGLLRAVFVRIQDEVLAAIAASGPAPPTTLSLQVRAGLEAAFLAYGCDERRLRISCLEAVGVSAAFEALRRQTSRRFVDQLVRGLDSAAQGGERLPADYRLLGVGLVGSVAALLVDWAATATAGRAPLRELAEAASRIYLRTLNLPEQ